MIESVHIHCPRCKKMKEVEVEFSGSIPVEGETECECGVKLKYWGEIEVEGHCEVAEDETSDNKDLPRETVETQ